MRNWLCALSLIFLASCEKDIEFDPGIAETLLVVDGSIENDKPPMIFLTRSFSYFAALNPATLADAFVHDAEVYLSNGSLTHRLKEYSFPLAPGINAFYYSIDSTSLGSAFVGELNKTYSLRIVSENKEYNASTRIPALATYPDSVWLKPAPMNPDTNARVLFIKTTDPAGRGNYIRYFTRVDQQPFLPGENSVYDDQVIDGTTYEVQLPGGIDRNNPPRSDENFFHRGDTVTLKFCNIDRPTYVFWSTWEFAYQGIGNPFAQPNKVIGNISNGALGAFCGYAAWYRTVIAR